MSFHEQAPVIGHDLKRRNPPAVPARLRMDRLLTLAPGAASQDRAAVLRAPHGVIPGIVDATCGNLHSPGHAGDYTHSLCQVSRFRRRKTTVPSRGA
jgi:hypothetical protein